MNGHVLTSRSTDLLVLIWITTISALGGPRQARTTDDQFRGRVACGVAAPMGAYADNSCTNGEAAQ